MSFSAESLYQSLPVLPATARYVLAFSGGLDSHVLLHALTSLRHTHTLPPLQALHVHHGLHADAEQWSRHCQRVCDELEVPLGILRVNAEAACGESPEAAARAARYQALTAQMGPEDCLLTAHHQDDQAETLLLQLLRGGGPHGLAAMAACGRLGGGWHARPLLNYSRAQLRHYAQTHGLQWIEDDSNADTSFDRNYLRHHILPLLQQRWPAASATLARSAQHCADAAALIDQCARADLQALGGQGQERLPVAGLLQLDAPRRRHALRAWFEHLQLPLPSTAHLQQVQGLLLAREDAVPRVCWPGAEVRRFQGQLYAMAPLSAHDPTQVLHWDAARPLLLSGLRQRLLMRSVAAGGLDAGRLAGHRLTVRFRSGGEQCRPAGRGHRKELKKLLQELRVPPWERQRIPLLYVDEELAAIAGHLVCEGFQAPTGHAGLLPVLESVLVPGSDSLAE